MKCPRCKQKELTSNFIGDVIYCEDCLSRWYLDNGTLYSTRFPKNHVKLIEDPLGRKFTIIDGKKEVKN